MKKYILLLTILTAIFSGCTKNAEDYYNEAKKYSESKDYAQAISLYEKSCELGSALACSSLAYLYEKGIGVEKDLNKSDELNIKACDLGSANSCYYMARLKSDNITEFLSYMDKSCSLDFSAGCITLGNVYLNGFNENMVTLEKDKEKGLSYISKACELDNQYCANLADIYISGYDVPQNYEEAVKYYEQSINYFQDKCKEYDEENIACINIKILKAKYSYK